MSRTVQDAAAGESRAARNPPDCSGQGPDASLSAAEALQSADAWGTWSGVYRQGGCIPFAFPGLPEIGCVFGTALCGNIRLSASGDGDAVTCRETLLAAVGLAHWVELCQVHKDGFIVDARPTPTELPAVLEADGSCTRERGLGLLVKTADCQPLFFAAGDGTAVAALHVGWRGNAADYPAVGLSRFCEAYGLDPAGVLAVRGPSLGPSASEFVNFGKEWPAAFAPWFDTEKQTMDLWRLTRDQLMRAGMPGGNIFSLDLCTRSLPGLFFSHRRGDEGRQGSLIWIRPTGEPALARREKAQRDAGGRMSKAYWKLSVRAEFSAAHALRNYGGKCENTHGHNFRVEAVVRGDRLDPSTGISADFSLLRQDLNMVLSGLDHRNLNDTPPFDRINPSSENLSRHIFQGMAPLAEKRGVRLCSVGVWEKEAQSAVYCEEE